MHIAFVLSGLGAGGAERVVSLISSRWVARGWKVTIIAFDAPGDPIYHPFDARIGIERLALPPSRSGALAAVAAMLKRVRALRRALQRLRPDTTIAFLTKINALTLLATVGLDGRVIVSERNNPKRQAASRLWNLLLSGLYRRASAIVMQTEASLSCLPSACRKRAVVIPNPIDAAGFEAAGASAHTIVAVGRLSPQKGFDLLLEAFARLADRHPSWSLTIWGEGPERSALQGKIAALGLEDRVSMPGLTDKPGAWCANASIFVLPSRFEGFPNVLGEAMAAGLAVAAFDCSFGPRDMITPDVDGLLVADGDVDELGAALERLIQDEALRKRLGTAARSGAQRFSVDTILGRWDTLILKDPSACSDSPGTVATDVEPKSPVLG